MTMLPEPGPRGSRKATESTRPAGRPATHTIEPGANSGAASEIAVSRGPSSKARRISSRKKTESEMAVTMPINANPVDTSRQTSSPRRTLMIENLPPHRVAVQEGNCHTRPLTSLTTPASWSKATCLNRPWR